MFNFFKNNKSSPSLWISNFVILQKISKNKSTGDWRIIGGN